MAITKWFDSLLFLKWSLVSFSWWGGRRSRRWQWPYYTFLVFVRDQQQQASWHITCLHATATTTIVFALASLGSSHPNPSISSTCLTSCIFFPSSNLQYPILSSPTSKKIDNCRAVSIKVPFRRPLCCSNQGIIVICQHIWKKGLLHWFQLLEDRMLIIRRRRWWSVFSAQYTSLLLVYSKRLAIRKMRPACLSCCCYSYSLLAEFVTDHHKELHRGRAGLVWCLQAASALLSLASSQEKSLGSSGSIKKSQIMM